MARAVALALVLLCGSSAVAQSRIEVVPPGPDEDAIFRMMRAHDAGYRVGVGAPLIGWGAVYAALGGVALAMVAGMDEERRAVDWLVPGLALGIGASQLIPGVILVVTGQQDRPEADLDARRAYDAGYDHGWGNCMTGYGVFFGVSLLSQLAAPGSVSSGTRVGALATTAALAGLHLGFGIASRADGVEAWERLQGLEEPRTTWLMLPPIAF